MEGKGDGRGKNRGLYNLGTSSTHAKGEQREVAKKLYITFTGGCSWPDS